MNQWIAHVKAVAKSKGISYSQALKVASSSYKKGKKTTSGGAIEGTEPVPGRAGQQGFVRRQRPVATTGVASLRGDEKLQYGNIDLLRKRIPLTSEEEGELQAILELPSGQRLERLRAIEASIMERLRREVSDLMNNYK